MVEKSSSDRLNEVIAQLTPNQLRFVVARQNFTSDKEAAEAIDLAPSTVYKWKPNTCVKEAIQLMAEDITSVAAAIRQRNLAKAMMVKVAALDNDDISIRQKAATEIIEWEMGKPAQKVDATHQGTGPGGKIEVKHSVEDATADILSKLAGIAATASSGGLPEESDATTD